MEAFQILASSDYMENLSPTDKQTIRVYKSRILKGNKINLEGILEKHGFVKVKESEWKRKGIEK